MEYVVCNNERYEASLKIGKIYRVNTEIEKLPRRAYLDH